MKEKLTTAPILSYPLEGYEFVLDTDASQFTVGAILSQEQNGEERVIAYMSKTMNKHELQYCTTRKVLSFLLPLFQKGQLSVTGESMCTKYWLTA